MQDDNAEDRAKALREEYVHQCVAALVDGAWSMDDDALSSCLIARRLSLRPLRHQWDFIKQQVLLERPDLRGT